MKYQTALITLASVNLERSVAFYKTLLEQSPDPYLPEKYAEFQLSGGLRVGIFKPKATHETEFSQPQNSAISLCLEVVNLENAIAELAQLGYPPLNETISASHGQEIYAYDPDGNRLILHCSQKSTP